MDPKSLSVFAEQWSEVLGAVHSLLAIVMLVALIVGAIFLYVVSVNNWKHVQISGLVAALAYLATFGIGLILPNASGLFEIKENLAALGAFIALALVVLIVFGKLRRTNTWRRQLYGALFAMLTLLALSVIALAYLLVTRKLL
ncbi:MAG: hypothetical protein V1895_01930 [Parcubacteria group bacterium]